MKRREFILIPAKALGGLVLYSLVGELIPAPAEDGVKVPLRFFTAAGSAGCSGGLRAHLSQRRKRPWGNRSGSGDLHRSSTRQPLR